MKLNTDDLRLHEAQMVKTAKETSYKTSLMHTEVNTIRNKYSSHLLFESLG